MGIHSIKKTIAIGILVVFIWTGMVWATEKGIADTQKAFGGFQLAKPPASVQSVDQTGRPANETVDLGNATDIIAEVTVQSAEDEGRNPLPEQSQTARAVYAVDQKNNYADFMKERTDKNDLVQGQAGDFNYRYVVLSEAEIADVLAKKLLPTLNSEDIFIMDIQGYFVEGQRRGFAGEGFAFITDGKTTTYVNFKDHSLWMYDRKDKKFTDFSTSASASFWVGAKEYDGVLIGFDLIGFAKYFAARGWSKNSILDQLGFVSRNFGTVCTDDKGAIIDKMFQRAIVYLNNGAKGFFTVSGQLRADPVTGVMKGVNFAEIEGKYFAGMGAELVDVQTLLTDAKYNKLALLVLNDKSLRANMIVWVAGSWLLQHNQLNGVSDDIKKYLDYDVSNMPNGFTFNVSKDKVEVVAKDK